MTHDIVIHCEGLGVDSLDSVKNEIMNDIALQIHILRAIDNHSFAQTRRYSRVSDNFGTSDCVVELDSREISLLLRAIVNGNIIKSDLTLSIREVSWLEEISDENLTAIGSWVRWSHTLCISARCYIHIAGQEEHFASHIDWRRTGLSEASCTIVICT